MLLAPQDGASEGEDGQQSASHSVAFDGPAQSLENLLVTQIDDRRGCHPLDGGKKNRGRCLSNRTHLAGEADFLPHTVPRQAELDPDAVATKGIHLLESEVRV